MANTFELIYATTLSGSQASISFTVIPSTYTDLCIKFSARSTSSTGNYDPLIYRFNTSATGYNVKDIGGAGSGSGTSGSNTTMTSAAATWTAGRATDYGIDNGAMTASTFTNGEFYIPNYAGSSQKSFSLDYVNENNAALAHSELVAGLWTGTAAITQIDLALYYGSFSQYSSFYLYGVKKNA